MGSFAWEIETFGTKDKQLKISRGVINWLGSIHLYKIYHRRLLFVCSPKHDMRSKQRLGSRKGKSKNKFSFGSLSVNKNFRLNHRQEATSVPFLFYTRYWTSPNRSRSHADHMVSQWISDATLLFLVKMKRVTKCWKTTIFNFFLSFFVLRG